MFHRDNLTFLADKKNDPMNELMLSMIGAFAQFERSVLKERQAEGIEKAKAKGVSIRALSRASIVTLY